MRSWCHTVPSRTYRRRYRAGRHFCGAQLARARTAFDARKPTTTIVSDGAFQYSRNPTYLALTLLYVGFALVLGSPWVLLMVVPAVALTQWGVVLREERYLEAKFGEAYRRYKTNVRRWL
jgi:protein-S-isoprenylcysteine O-methyltransferase Ste14